MLTVLVTTRFLLIGYYNDCDLCIVCSILLWISSYLVEANRNIIASFEFIGIKPFSGDI